MPRGDGTGPDGLGPMTGRNAGYCAGYNGPGYANTGDGKGLGLARGFRGGRGSRGARPAKPPAGTVRRSRLAEPQVSEEKTEEIELKNLKRTAEDLEDQMEAVKKRIQQLQAETD